MDKEQKIICEIKRTLDLIEMLQSSTNEAIEEAEWLQAQQYWFAPERHRLKGVVQGWKTKSRMLKDIRMEINLLAKKVQRIFNAQSKSE